MIWILFIVLVCIFLALDLGVLNKESHIIKASEAFKWTALWAVLSLAFAGFIYFGYENAWLGLGTTVGEAMSGKDAALEYLSGYLV